MSGQKGTHCSSSECEDREIVHCIQRLETRASSIVTVTAVASQRIVTQLSLTFSLFSVPLTLDAGYESVLVVRFVFKFVTWVARRS